MRRLHTHEMQKQNSGWRKRGATPRLTRFESSRPKHVTTKSRWCFLHVLPSLTFVTKRERERLQCLTGGRDATPACPVRSTTTTPAAARGPSAPGPSRSAPWWWGCLQRGLVLRHRPCFRHSLPLVPTPLCPRLPRRGWSDNRQPLARRLRFGVGGCHRFGRRRCGSVRRLRRGRRFRFSVGGGRWLTGGMAAGGAATTGSSPSAAGDVGGVSRSAHRPDAGNSGTCVDGSGGGARSTASPSVDRKSVV